MTDLVLCYLRSGELIPLENVSEIQLLVALYAPVCSALHV